MTTSLGLLLIVDDEEMNRDMLSRRLQIEGYDAMTAPSGAVALEMIAEHDFDAILLDAMMPIMSGPEGARRNPQNEERHRAASAHGDGTQSERRHGAGL